MKVEEVLLADEAEKVEVRDGQLTKKVPQLTQNLTEEERRKNERLRR